MRRKIPSTAALIAFDAAARHGSYTSAAGELALTQSAVCRQLAGLEAFLGVKLFRRARRGVLLTDAGQAYHRQVAARLDEVERDTLALMAGQGPGGSLDVAVVPTFGVRWLVPRLPDFKRQHGGITVNLASRTQPFPFEDSGLDAAIYTGDGNWPGAVAVHLMPERLVPVCSPALLGRRKKLTPAELATLPLLQQSTRPYAWRQWFESTGTRSGHELVGPRYELFSMSMQAAAVGMGVALVPDLDLADELVQGRLVIPVDHTCPSDRAYYFVTPERKQDSAPLQALRQWLLSQCSAQGQGTAGRMARAAAP